MTTLKPRQRSITHVLEHAQTHHGIPLHTKDARNSTSDSARNSRARHPTRPSKCTISSTVRAWSGTPTTTETLHMRASNTPKGIVGFLCTQKVLATAAPARQRAQLSGARHQPLAHPNALSRALHGPGVARPRTQPQKRHARVLSTCRDESRDPFALKRCVLETCCTSKVLAERPTSRPPKSFIWSVTRVVSGASTHTCTDSLRMLTLAPPKRLPGTPLHSESAHNIRHLRERAHLLDERATSRSSNKCIISSAAPVLSSVLMHTPVGTLRTRALAMPKACREPFAVIYGARNGTSHSARISCLSDPPLAHQMRHVKPCMGPEWLRK